MEKVLLIAHHFPPMGGPGSYRSLQLARHLPDHGYRPVILTITEENIANGYYPFDHSLLPGADEFETLRVSTGEPVQLKKILMKVRLYRLAWIFLYPFFWESSALWPFRAFPIAARYIRQHNIQFVYTSSGPYSSLILGYLLKRFTGVGWVADLRDPFTDAYAWRWPSKAHWYACRFFERLLLRRPDRVVVNTPAVRDLYLSRGLVEADRLHVITNGFS